MQRSRLMSAAVGLLADKGYEAFSAAAVCERAGISRRTFYELFEDREACLLAILGEAEARMASVISGMGLSELAWCERIRMGLWALLCLADSEPVLALVCLVESQRAGGRVQRVRQQMIERIVEVIDEGRSLGARSSTAGELTAEALVGAATSVIAARLTETTGARAGTDTAKEGRLDASDVPRVCASDTLNAASLRGLLGELVGMIVLPYKGPAAARREIKRPLPSVPAIELAGSSSRAVGAEPLASLPIRLTYRTALVLQTVAMLTAEGSGASNRQIGEGAEISDPGQTSKLLSRLEAHGLLENAAAGNLARGEANQWQLTATGAQLVRSITAQPDAQHESRSAA
ncbi:MAG TPA: TetR/AcrR family transcriptional regulator [Solirubrobacteraceae bacterium]|jgi:AcrR family transcriptional regulator